MWLWYIAEVLMFLAMTICMSGACSLPENNTEDLSDQQECLHAYIDFFNVYDQNTGEFFDIDYASMSLTDLNNDGQPELFVFPGSADWHLNVYTYHNGEVKEIFRTSSAIHNGIDPIKGTPYCAETCGNSYGYYARIYQLTNDTMDELMYIGIPDWIEKWEYYGEHSDEMHFEYTIKDQLASEEDFFSYFEEITGIEANSENFFDVLYEASYHDLT